MVFGVNPYAISFKTVMLKKGISLMEHNPSLPLARKDKLVIQDSPDEILIYDQDQNKAHYLNSTVAFVWRHCDGKMDVNTVAQMLSNKLQRSDSTEEVHHALGQLEKLRLLL